MYSQPNFPVGHQPLKPLSGASFSNIRLVATDMDGTLTQRGKFSGTLLQALEDLATAGIKVLIVTGRSAGWMSGLSKLLPIDGAIAFGGGKPIAENGGLFYPSGHDQPVSLTPIVDLETHRQSLAVTFAELKILGNLCQDMGWGFTYDYFSFSVGVANVLKYANQL